jgi:hypothetical protein
MQFCIEEWDSGDFKDSGLNVNLQARDFEDHYNGLRVYERRAAGRLTRFREEWFQYGMYVPQLLI